MTASGAKLFAALPSGRSRRSRAFCWPCLLALGLRVRARDGGVLSVTWLREARAFRDDTASLGPGSPLKGVGPVGDPAVTGDLAVPVPPPAQTLRSVPRERACRNRRGRIRAKGRRRAPSSKSQESSMGHRPGRGQLSGHLRNFVARGPNTSVAGLSPATATW